MIYCTDYLHQNRNPSSSIITRVVAGYWHKTYTLHVSPRNLCGVLVQGQSSSVRWAAIAEGMGDDYEAELGKCPPPPLCPNRPSTRECRHGNTGLGVVWMMLDDVLSETLWNS